MGRNKERLGFYKYKNQFTKKLLQKDENNRSFEKESKNQASVKAKLSLQNIDLRKINKHCLKITKFSGCKAIIITFRRQN